MGNSNFSMSNDFSIFVDNNFSISVDNNFSILVQRRFEEWVRCREDCLRKKKYFLIGLLWLHGFISMKNRSL